MLHDELPRAVGRRIREVRIRLDLSQEALAERADLHRNYVGGIERGERDVGLIALGKLTAGLGVSLAEFFEPFSKVRLHGRKS